tara:strand:+ start:81 stop:347 length:267 start_codon:yes stop_codon:yes gene_type:complete
VSLVLVALVEPMFMRMGPQAVSVSAFSLVGAAVAVPHTQGVVLVAAVAAAPVAPVLVLPVPLTAAAVAVAVGGRAAAAMPVVPVVLAL